MRQLVARGYRVINLDARGHENLPQLELFDVSGAGHMVAGDRNDAFNAGVVRFLERYLPMSGPAGTR